MTDPEFIGMIIYVIGAFFVALAESIITGMDDRAEIDRRFFCGVAAMTIMWPLLMPIALGLYIGVIIREKRKAREDSHD